MKKICVFEGMSGDQVKAFLQRWQAMLGAGGATAAAVLAVLAWSDTRYVPRAELGPEKVMMLAELDTEELVKKEDLTPIKENLAFLAREFIRDRITSLESRIQIMEGIPNLSRDDRRTLNELRYERARLQERLNTLQ